MELLNLFRAMMLYMSNIRPDKPFIGSHPTWLSEPAGTKTTPIANLGKETIFATDDTSGNYKPSPGTAIVPYDFDCAIPFPPMLTPERNPSFVGNSGQPNSEQTHTKATFTIPIHIVHRFPESELGTLHR